MFYWATEEIKWASKECRQESSDNFRDDFAHANKSLGIAYSLKNDYTKAFFHFLQNLEIRIDSENAQAIADSIFDSKNLSSDIIEAGTYFLIWEQAMLEYNIDDIESLKKEEPKFMEPIL
jgi:hypothetical protein